MPINVNDPEYVEAEKNYFKACVFISSSLRCACNFEKVNAKPRRKPPGLFYFPRKSFFNLLKDEESFNTPKA